MSDDRFKEARRSLIDGEDRDGEDSSETDEKVESENDDFADAKTRLVDVADDEETRKVDRSDLPTGEEDFPPSRRDDLGDADRPGGFAGPSDMEMEEETDEVATSRRSGTSQSAGSREHRPLEERRTTRAPAVDREEVTGGGDHGSPSAGRRSGSGQQKVFVPGDDEGGSDEKTAFVDIDKFADDEPNPATFAPEESRAGYDGNTQFVEIDTLMGSEDADKTRPSEPSDVLEDGLLRRSYDFGEEDIDRGEIDLVYAYNATGKPVVLRQVWDGDADDMPAEMRQRINRLDELDAPNLLSLNGMLITETGAWLELNCPTGRRMSDILTSEGPQSPERVLSWIRSAGETLAAIHEHQLVYANLTPRAIWIEENGEEEKVLLEPFDLMRLEDRGDLGQFGPPEMDAGVDERRLSPATDVYSLAAVTLAGLTGIPLRPERVAGIESDRITDAVRDAVVDDPRERLDSVDEFLERLDSASSSSLANVEFELNIRTAIVVMFVLTLIAFGALYFQRQMRSEQNASAPAPRGASTADESATSGDSSGGSSDDGNSGTGGDPKVEAPGPLETDSRLVSIETSYRLNPPPLAEAAPASDSEEEAIESLRKQARAKLEEAEDQEGEERLATLKEALRPAAEVIRRQGENVDERDRQIFEKLRSRPPIESYYSELVERIERHLEEGALEDAQIAYRQFGAITPDADDAAFFEQTEDAEVVPVSNAGSNDDEPTVNEGDQ